MLIAKHPTLQKKLKFIFSQQDFNISYASVLIESFLEQKPWLSKKRILTLRSENLPDEAVHFQNLLIEKFSTHKALKHHENYLNDVIPLSVKKLDVKPYKDNLYYQSVKPKPVTMDGWSLNYDDYLPYQGVVAGDLIVSAKAKGFELTPIGYFTETFSYLAIKQNDVTWMSVTPFEMNSMAPILSKMEGVVVTLGLGLGYFAAMASMKPNVQKVIVVEKDQRVITLFKTHILPSLPHQEKIKILHQDAFDYLKQTNIKANHIFVDIYRTADDGLPLYLQTKSFEKNFSNIHWHYWLEASILSLIRRYMIIFLHEQVEGKDASHYPSSDSFQDKLYHRLFLANQQTSIEHVAQLDAWLSRDSIKSFITFYLGVSS
jgi:hypothetical protein